MRSKPDSPSSRSSLPPSARPGHRTPPHTDQRNSGPRDSSGPQDAEPSHVRAEALRDWIPKVLQEMGLDAANDGAALLRAWNRAAGPELAKHSHPQGIRRGVIHATVPDSAWMQRAQLAKARILRTLRSELGDDTARDLRFRIAVPPRS